MRIAYFDCFSGVSGDMVLGSLIDAGLSLDGLRGELEKLGLSGYTLKASRTDRRGIGGTHFSVITDERGATRTVEELVRIIRESELDPDLKTTSENILTTLGAVEAKIHGKKLDEIHLHEAGGLDSIIDMVGSVIGLKKLGVEAVYASRIHVGTGFVECQHGTLPVPAPATLALLAGIPTYSRGIEAELATPTGVAILKTLARSFGPMPPMTVESTGYGAGRRELELPNLLRVSIGESAQVGNEIDEPVLIEANLDDMNPEFFGYASEILWEHGALDVFMTPIFMKKNRPGTTLSVLTNRDSLEEMVSTLFSETSTFGVRILNVERRKLARETVEVATRFGRLSVKIGRSGGRITSMAPEYEDCKRAAREHGVPLKSVYDEAREAARKAFPSGKADDQGRP